MFEEAVKRRQALQQVSDKELMEELRARGRLVELSADCVAPGHAVNMGYPVENQWREIGHILGDALVRRHLGGDKPFMDFKVERGYFDSPFYGPPISERELHRKVSVQMYYLRAK